jgi:predicted enzyme related to lactoylglutathione lyase
MAHPIVHIEFASSDPKATGKFCGELFGWNITTAEEFNYVMFQSQENVGGGFPPADDDANREGSVIVYVETDDIEKTLARAEELGGRTLVPKMEIPGTGWFAIFSDPTGVRLALYTSMTGQAQS